MAEQSLLQEPHRSVLTELANDPEVQELLASAIRQREALIDKIVALAGKKGIKLKKVSEQATVDSVAAQHQISRSDYTLDLSEWLQSRNLTWSKLAPA